MIEKFIQDNLIWITPAVSIIFSVIVNILSKKSKLSLKDFLNWGFGLSITAIILCVTNINTNSNPNLGSWILIGFIIVFLITLAVVNRLDSEKNPIGIEIMRLIIPDIIGIGLLIVSILYVGGIIK